jgi:hypothetical protein
MVKALITVENINHLNIFPVFNILTIDVPKNSKKVGACKNDNDKLSNFITLEKTLEDMCLDQYNFERSKNAK